MQQATCSDDDGQCHEHEHTRQVEKKSDTLVAHMFDKFSHVRMQTVPKLVVDICAGDHSVAKYYLRKYTDCVVLSLDIKPKEEALRTVPKHLHSRISYIQMNVQHLTDLDLAREVRKAWPHLSMQDCWHTHFSPDCTTMSTAERKTGRCSTAYRLPDGTPNPDAPQYRQNRVLQHDRVMNQVLQVLTVLGRKYPNMLITAENPVGAFKLQPQVKKMCDYNEGWRILDCHYCASADPKYDGGTMWPMKPTNILIKGGRSELKLPQCNFDCKYRIPNTNRHLVAIRIDERSHPAQTRVTGHMRHAIPTGLFDHISHSHVDSMFSDARDGDDNMVRNAPAGMHALIDESHAQQIAQSLANKFSTCTVQCKGCRQHINNVVATQSLATQAQWRLMHARYGHSSQERIGMKKLKGLHKVRCPTCLAAKLTRKAHTGSLLRASYALELVHSDLAEFRTTDVDGYKYAAIFVDDKTDRKWVYLLKNKSDYGEAFKLWLSEVGVPPSRVRSDWGGEYKSELENQFLKICLERGIWPEKSAPYNPQQNSKAERSIRSIVEMARSMLLHAKMDKQYWGYALRYACYLDMHLISSRTSKTPYEMWFGHEAVFDPPVFGSQVYFRHEERNEDKKLDPKGHKARFLGYPSGSPGYYVQNLDRPGSSVKVTNDVPISSFDEVTGMNDDETVIATQDDFELTVPDVNAEVVPDAIPLLGDDRTGIPQERIEYWHSFQKYAGLRRASLADTMPEEEVRSKILNEWKTQRLGAATAIATEIDNGTKYDSVRKRLRSNESRPIEVTAQPKAEAPVTNRKSTAKPKSNPISADLACEICSSPQDEMNMLICDECEKGYHRTCMSMTRLPAKAHGWVCHKCINPGMRITKYWNSDKTWHDGTVTMQYSHVDKGTDIEYDDGSREHTNLNHCRWKPIYDNTHAGIGYTGMYDRDIAYDWMSDDYFIGNIAAWCPKTHTDILKTNPTIKQKWLASEDKEWNTILSKDAIKIVPLQEVPRNAIFVGTKWAYRVKADGTLKSRLCVLGNTMPTADFDTSAPTPRLSSVRVLLKKAIEEDLEVRILDLQCAFLNAPARGQTYLRLPPGRNKKGYAALLLRNLYGSTHAPRAWHNMLHNWFVMNGFRSNPHDPCIYTRFTDGTYMHAIVHVDDICYIGSTAQVDKFKAEITKAFSIDDLGSLGVDPTAKRYLGIEIERKSDRFILHNKRLLQELIHNASKYDLPKTELVPIKDIRLSIDDCPQTDEDRAKVKGLPYRQLLGQIGYACLCSRNDCSYAYKEVSRFSNNFGIKHWNALLSLCAYLRDTIDTHVMHISKGGGMKLTAWSDADWNGQPDQHLSTTGWIIFLGDAPISWSSKTQRCTARSTAEAEYIAASSCAQEIVYLQMLTASIEHHTSTVPVFTNTGTEEDPGIIRRWREWVQQNGDTAHHFTDSLNAIANARMPPGWLQEALRHIKTHFHFVKQFILDRSISLEHCRGERNCSDIFTKGYGTSKTTTVNQRADAFKKHAKFCLGMRDWATTGPRQTATAAASMTH